MWKFTGCPLDCRAQWMMPEMEDGVIFSWLSTCRADWNGLAIVYKSFWSDPLLWTYLSWPWPLRPLSYWLKAAVYTVHINQWIPIIVLFTTQPAYLDTCVRNVLLDVSVHSPVFVSICDFSSVLHPVLPQSLVLLISQNAKEQFHRSRPQFLCPCLVNWVRSSQDCWCVSEFRQ